MEEVELKLNSKGNGSFELWENGERMGEMVVGIAGNELTVFHTEVIAKAEGRGLARKLLDSMVHYAREHAMKVIPLCPYVHAQFKRHPEQYADIWKKQTGEEE